MNRGYDNVRNVLGGFSLLDRVRSLPETEPA
jgi:hypothetical protein